jgi:hypothetical protein
LRDKCRPPRLQIAVGVHTDSDDYFYCEAIDVSADDSKVLGYDTRENFSEEPFIWDATNGMVRLGHLPGGGSFTHPRAISADGSTVVGAAA